MINPLFSVLIANYNNAKFIEECINSIINQTYKNIEIIIVDDFSTDNSIQIIKNLQTKYSNIYLKNNIENRGAGYTKKMCIDSCSGEICGFVDPDDALVENAVEIMVEKHLELPEASLIYSLNYRCDENLKITGITKFVKQQPKNVLIAQKTYVDHFVTFKKSLYVKTDGTDPNVKRAVDRDLYCLLDQVGKVVFVDVPLYYYRIHKGGISKTSNIYKAEYWDWIVKHKYLQKNGLSNEDEYSEKIMSYFNNTDYIPTSTLLSIIFKRILNKFK